MGHEAGMSEVRAETGTGAGLNSKRRSRVDAGQDSGVTLACASPADNV